jgi:hypothetical protein
MAILMIVLRLIHIFGGVFWVGVSFFNIGFLTPTVQATGAEGQKVMQHLTRQTRLLNATYGAATGTLLSGLLMYGILTGLRADYLLSPYGLVLGLGGLAGLVAWAFALVVIRGIFAEMGALGRQIQSQGGPPTAEQGAAMRALGARLGQNGRIALVFQVLALVGMSIAQYVTGL